MACGISVSAVFQRRKSSRRKPSNANSTVRSLRISVSMSSPLPLTHALVSAGIPARERSSLMVFPKSPSEISALEQRFGEDQQHLSVTDFLEVILPLKLRRLDGFIQEFPQHVAGAGRIATGETRIDR